MIKYWITLAIGNLIQHKISIYNRHHGGGDEVVVPPLSTISKIMNMNDKVESLDHKGLC